MSLTTRFVTIIGSFAAAMTVVAIVMSHLLVVRAALRLDDAAARETAQHALNVLEDERAGLFSTLADWSIWDDSYEFVTTTNAAFIERNLMPASLRELELNALAYFDAQAGLLHAVGRERDLSEAVPVPADVLGIATNASGPFASVPASGAAAGYVHCDGSVWLLGMMPILRSDESGPSRGSLLMGRRFDAAETARLAGMAHETLTITTGRVTSAGVTIVPLNRSALDVRAPLPGVLVGRGPGQTPAPMPGREWPGHLGLSMQLPRPTYASSIASGRHLAAWLLAIGAAIAGIAYWMLDRWVLRDITRSVHALRAGISAISPQPGTPRTRLSAGQSGEMAELARAIDDMLDAFERAEQEAGRRREEAVQAQKLAAPGTLVAGIAHEVNNPNAAISLNMHVMQRHLRTLVAQNAPGQSGLVQEAQELVQETIEASNRISTFIGSLRDYARPVENRVDEHVDINETVRRSIDWVRHDLEMRQCHLTLDLATDLPMACGRSPQLQQVFVNLVKNACEACTGPGMPLTVRSRHDAAGRRIIVTVADRGRGIPPENLDRIMDPFFTTRQKDGGTGLGLSISALIVRSHGGTMQIESAVGQGTAVHVLLPSDGNRRHDDASRSAERPDPAA